MIRGKASHLAFETLSGKNVDPHHIFMGIVPHMVDLARRAAHEEAYSYRGFHVGGSAFAFLPGMRETVLLSAGNTKYENQQKICAEMKLLQQLERYGVAVGDTPHVIGMTVVGTSDSRLIEEVTGMPTPTLHPCRECRGLLHDSQLVNDDTLIVTTGLETDAYQAHTFGQLRDYYDSGSNGSDAALQTSPGLDDWHVRQAIFDVMSAPLSHHPMSSIEAARIALGSILLDRPVQAEARMGYALTDEEEAERLKKIARIVAGQELYD